MARQERPIAETLRKTRDALTGTTDTKIVDRLLNHGIRDYVLVSCSVTKTIEDIWQKLHDSGEINLIRTTHEDNLVGIYTGIWLGTGRLPLILTQNSGLPDLGHGIETFARSYKIPILAIVTWRGNKPEGSEVHDQIGKDTEKLTRVFFDDKIFGTRMGRGLLRAVDAGVDSAKNGDIACIRVSQDGFRNTHKLSLDSAEVVVFSEEDLKRYKKNSETKGTKSNPIRNDVAISRDDAIRQIVDLHSDAAILFSNGYTARAAQAKADRLGNFYITGYMGGALAIGWALAKNNPHINVVVVDGDQNAQRSNMKDHLTIDYPPNLNWYILNNGIGASVGISKSLPLIPQYYELARVILTIPDDPNIIFPHQRVKGVGKYFETNEAREMAQRIGPLPVHTTRFKDWIARQTERNKQKVSR